MAVPFVHSIHSRAKPSTAFQSHVFQHVNKPNHPNTARPNRASPHRAGTGRPPPHRRGAPGNVQRGPSPDVSFRLQPNSWPLLDPRDGRGQISHLVGDTGEDLCGGFGVRQLPRRPPASVGGTHRRSGGRCGRSGVAEDVVLCLVSMKVNVQCLLCLWSWRRVGGSCLCRLCAPVFVMARRSLARDLHVDIWSPLFATGNCN